jgi:hypothetical protein
MCVQLLQSFCVHCFAKYLRTSGPNEFNYCRAFKIFVSIALLNLWGHRDQMCSTTLERLRSVLLLIAKYMRTSGPNEFNYCRAFEIFVSIALLNIWGHQDQMSSTTAERFWSFFMALVNIWGHQDLNEFNYCRAFDIFVSIALLNIWGHQDQMSSTTAEHLRSLFPLLC